MRNCLLVCAILWCAASLVWPTPAFPRSGTGVSALVSQTIDFPAVPNQTILAPAFQLSATGGGSGNPVTFQSLTSDICAVSGMNGQTVSMLALGTCTIRASQQGNATHADAAPYDRSFSVTKVPQAITLTQAIYDVLITDAPMTLTASGGDSGNPVVFFSPAFASCSTSGTNGSVVTFRYAYNCQVYVDQAGNDIYEAAPRLFISFNIRKVGQRIQIAHPISMAVGETATIQVRGGPSGNPVQFHWHSTDQCTVSGHQVTIRKPDAICDVRVRQDGNDQYLPAESRFYIQTTDAPGVPAPVTTAFAPFNVSASGYPALPNARFAFTPAAEVSRSFTILAADTTPGTPYDSLSNGVMWSPILIPANPDTVAREFVVFAQTEVNDYAPDIRLFMGEDVDGDGPELSEERCRRANTQRAQYCEVRIVRDPGAPAALWWAVAQNVWIPPTNGYSTHLRVAAVPFRPDGTELVATGPGKVEAGEPFQYRIHWDSSQFRIGISYMAYLLVYSQPGVLVRQEPIWLSSAAVLGSGPILFDGIEQTAKLNLQSSTRTGVFDIPPNATSVTFSVEGSDQLELRLSTEEAPFPGGVGVMTERYRSATTATNHSVTLTGANLVPGRWQLTAVNKIPGSNNVRFRAQVDARQPRDNIRPGHYFYPGLQGNGLFLDFTADQWVAVWYTYDDSGEPTWFYAQGSAPTGNDSQWEAQLHRVVWNGQSSSATPVGRIVLTIFPGDVAASPKLGMLYDLYGVTRWLPLTRLGDDNCPVAFGQKLDAQGHWFSPERPGFGYSSQYLPNTEVHAIYIYDAQGEPRWLYGQKDFSTTQDTLRLLQLRDFCAWCETPGLTSTEVGTMTRTLANFSNGDGLPGVSNIKVDATLAPPLRGTWQQDLPVFLLASRKGCN